MDGIAVIAAFVGTVLCFFGYRLFTSAQRLVGFVLGGAAMVLILSVFVTFKEPIYLQPLAIGAFLVGGIIGAIFAGQLYLGLVFMTAAYFGWILVMTVLPIVTRAAPSTLVAIVLALIFGLLSIQFQEIVLIVATSFIGAAGISYAAMQAFKVSDIPLMVLFFLVMLFGAAAQYKNEHP